MMRKALLYILFPALLFTLPGCLIDKAAQERIKWQLNLEKENKLPYGTYLAFQSLKFFFPDAHIESLPRSFRYSNMDNTMKYNYAGHSLLILHGLDFYISVQEWKDMKQFINSGNEVVLFCSRLDNKIEQELNCYKELRNDELQILYDHSHEEDNQHILRTERSPLTRYGYTGRSLMGYFSFQADSSNSDTDSNTSYFSAYPDTLGYVNNKPDFVRYTLGEGHLTLHAAPLVFSNYFLLQDGNEDYLTAIWQTLPENINRIYWNDYYIRTVESAGIGLLFKYPSTRLALLLAIFAILLYVLFEGKRKQRIIPIIPPLKNDSVSFVETVGRLYYNQGNHTNLSLKIVQQFLEWVRTHYFLNTNLLNENFIRQLTIKSGHPESTVRSLMEMIHEIKLGTAYIDDAYLYQLYNTIQLFYKNNRL